ncbi:MFS transporter [Pigmentibacter sp. JX0631]|uniref:MFS transporter n=1 Tax=Pigmentibacter sp. JX0631 TaxID=2976982 RepID=UPI002469AE84|nr:MFS transporter [Pigmentibacter sp. JX0631]WGL60813.1 MFS transporter [Pigmentibacter sp. JX0631]
MTTHQQSDKKTLFLCSLGGAFEFYDFSLFAIMSPIISQHFFDSSDPNLALIKSYGVLATGYFARFLGGFYFSHLGDTSGRKKPFMWTLFLMALPTLSIAFLPTYQQIGIIAPLFLIFFRIIQGFALGGEAPCAMTYIHEYSSDKKRSLSMSILFCGILLGSFFASLINTSLTSLLAKSDYESWGWRIPFAIGGILGLIGLYLRKNLQESKIFIACKNENKLSKTPFFTLLKNNYKNVFLGITILLPSATAFLHFLILSSANLQKNYNFNKQDIQEIVSLGFLVNAFSCVFFGYFADKINPKKIYSTGIVCLFILTVISSSIFSTQNFFYLSIYIFILAIVLGSCVGTVFHLLANLFSTHTRTSGIALCMNTTNGLFIGLTPIVFTEILTKTNFKLFPSYYICFLCFIGLISISLTGKRKFQ